MTDRVAFREKYQSYQTDYLLDLRKGELNDIAREELEKELEDRRRLEGEPRRGRQIKTPGVVVAFGVLMVLWGVWHLAITVSGVAAAEFLSPSMRSHPALPLLKSAWYGIGAAASIAFIVGGYRLVKVQQRQTLRTTQLIVWLGGPVAALVAYVVLPLLILEQLNVAHLVPLTLNSNFVPGVVVALWFTIFVRLSKRVRILYD